MKSPHASMSSGRRHYAHRARYRSCAAILLVLTGAFLAFESRANNPIRVFGITRSGSDISVSFAGVHGSSYRLERKLNLTDPTWQSISGLSDLNASTDAPEQMTDTGAISLGKAFYQVRQISPCDAGLASNSSAALDYAAAMELCATTTEQGTDPGVISAQLTLASGSGTPAIASRSIRPSFGANNVPLNGVSMVVLSTGAAAAKTQINPSYVAPQPGLDTGTSSTAPADFLAAHGGTFPTAPGCPGPPSTTAFNPIMLTLRIRVPNDAHSFSVSVKFFTSEFPEYVCTPHNDLFVALLDSSFAGTPANPADKNLATYTAPNGQKYPLNASLASGNTGLFTQCINGATGCAVPGSPGTITGCLSTSGLTGTGMDDSDPGNCNSNSLVGGATGWLLLRGNVVPGEIITLRFAIWDVSDGTYDSEALLDNFQWSTSTVTPGMSLP